MKKYISRFRENKLTLPYFGSRTSRTSEETGLDYLQSLSESRPGIKLKK